MLRVLIRYIYMKSRRPFTPYFQVIETREYLNINYIRKDDHYVAICGRITREINDKGFELVEIRRLDDDNGLSSPTPLTDGA